LSEKRVTTIVRSLATANPSRYVTGQEAYQFFATHFDMTGEERELYERLFLNGPIRGRYMSLDFDEQIQEMSADQQLERFQKFGTALASQAARDAMSAARLQPADVGGLVINTCTGYLCPGLSSYVAQALELDHSVKVMDLMGMGCGAAIPNLQCAAGVLALNANNGGCKPVVSVAVEVCSATIFMGPDPGLIVSNCLFGDGAAAAVLDLASDGDDGAAVRLLDFESGVFPAYREELRYRHEQGRLRNVLSKRVPVIGGRTIRHVAERLLSRHGLAVDQIDWWAVHPGGTAVLEQVRKELSIGEESLRYSFEVLREYGNMSSPSVLFVLKRLMEQGHPSRGQKGLLLSFGAGFTAFAALVEF
jgi:predicted naringenin-chalcone synthase